MNRLVVGQFLYLNLWVGHSLRGSQRVQGLNRPVSQKLSVRMEDSVGDTTPHREFRVPSHGVTLPQVYQLISVEIAADFQVALDQFLKSAQNLWSEWRCGLVAKAQAWHRTRAPWCTDPLANSSHDGRGPAVFVQRNKTLPSVLDKPPSVKGFPKNRLVAGHT